MKIETIVTSGATNPTMMLEEVIYEIARRIKKIDEEVAPITKTRTVDLMMARRLELKELHDFLMSVRVK